MNAAQLWQKIKPFAIRDLVNSSTGGGNTGASVALHSLNGPYHTGILARSQAPWVATDIASSIATHATLPNVHHAQGHVLATTTGLGADHTTSGLTTGQVLRATGATTAQFMALTNGDIVAALGYTPLNKGGDSSSGLQTFNAGIAVNVAATFNDISPALVANSAAGWWAYSYMNGTGGGAQNVFLRAGGTSSTPSVTLAGMSLGSFSFRGHTGSAFTGSKAYLSAVAAEDWTVTANGTYIQIQTTANGTTTMSPRLAIANDGAVIIGTGVTSTYKLDVTGSIYTSSSLTAVTSIITPTVTTGSGNLTLTASSGTVAVSGALTVTRTGTGGSTPADLGLHALLSSLQPSLALVDQSAGTDKYALHLNQSVFRMARYTDATTITDDLVMSGGKVGVGVVPTTYKFEVSGTARVTSSLYATTITTVSGDLTLTANSGAIAVSGASIGGVNWNIFTSGDATFAGSVYTQAVVANGYDLTVTSASNNLILNGTSNVDVRISGVSQWTMTNARLLPRSTLAMDIGDSNRRIRTLHAGELNVEILVAQSVMATIGGRIIVSPTNKLLADVALAATTIDVAYNNFVNGEYIYLSAAPGGSAQIEAMQVTSSATAISGGYRYSVSRNLDGTGANIWYAGDAVVSLRSAVGQGYIDLTSTNTIHNHYGPTLTFYVRTSTATWNSVAPVVSAGNLRSFVDYTGDEFGFATGNDLTLLPSAGFRGVTVDRTNGVRLFNTDIRLYESSTLRAAFEYADGLNLLADSSSTNKRQQINWWTDLTSRTGTPSSEIYTYLSGSYGPSLILQARAASGTNGVLLEIRANGNSGSAGALSILEDSGGARKAILDSQNVYIRWSGNERIWAGNDGVGINQTTASYALDVNGSCHASSFPTSSDRRFKEALTPLSPVLDRLGRIGTYNFYWRRNYAGYEQFLDEGRPQLQVGFVAQEVEQEFPELISRWRHVGRDGVATDDAYSVDYARMVPILVQAIRELRAELSALKSQ